MALFQCKVFFNLFLLENQNYTSNKIIAGWGFYNLHPTFVFVNFFSFILYRKILMEIENPCVPVPGPGTQGKKKQRIFYRKFFVFFVTLGWNKSPFVDFLFCDKEELAEIFEKIDVFLIAFRKNWKKW